VHEREVDLDFVFMILKSIMHVFKHLKLVLMSATINSELMSKYFSPEEISLERI